MNEIPDVQIFTTTHNTDLMSNDLLRPDCYFLLKNNSIKAISELTEKEARSERYDFYFASNVVLMENKGRAL